MASHHLAADRIDDLGESEAILLLGHARVIDDLQQEIAEFLAQIAHVAAFNGLRHLIGFLDRVGRDGPEVLLDIPGAADYRRAQHGHDAQEIVQRVGLRAVGVEPRRFRVGCLAIGHRYAAAFPFRGNRPKLGLGYDAERRCPQWARDVRMRERKALAAAKCKRRLGFYDAATAYPRFA
jgi:hypothetical protein